MSKTPFEIRMELLKLAKESLFEPIFIQRDNLNMAYEAAKERDPTTKFPDFPKFPTTAEIIAEAEKLNAFVSGK